MKYCSLKNPLPSALCMLLVLCVLGLASIGMGIDYLTAFPDNLFFPLFFLLTGAALCAGGLFAFAALTIEYSADERGLSVRLLRRFTAFHPWKTVTSIVLCDTGDRLQDGGPLSISIRIAACGETCGPFAQPRSYNLVGGMDKWRTAPYHLRHMKSIVCIQWSPERMAEIAEASGMEIRECWSDSSRQDRAYRQMSRGE